MQRLAQLLSEERGLHTQLLMHIAEVDARGLYRGRAYASMFEYCVKALHMSEAEAYRVSVLRGSGVSSRASGACSIEVNCI